MTENLSKDRLVKLRNGSEEELGRVEAIHSDLYRLQVDDPVAFRSLCIICHGTGRSASTERLQLLIARSFLDDQGEPWDDVRDVVQSGTVKSESGTWGRRNPVLD